MTNTCHGLHTWRSPLLSSVRMGMHVQADTTLSKANRASAFDAGKNLRAEIISHGMESSISSGNWSIKRFRMERKGVTQV